jgi:hypothetical protein
MVFIYYLAVNFKSHHGNSGLIQKDAIIDHTLIFEANFCRSTTINLQQMRHLCHSYFEKSYIDISSVQNYRLSRNLCM